MIKGLNNIKIVTPDGIIQGNIEVDSGKIKGISQDNIAGGITFNEDVIVVPGFIDEHIHGVNGSDVMDGTLDSLENIAVSLAKEGTTSFLATTLTQDESVIIKALQTINHYMKIDNKKGSELLGVHLEGPFIDSSKKGAQPQQFIVLPDINVFKKYQSESGNHIKFVTLAPEEPGGYELIHYCKENHIVASLGHTNAKYDEVVKAIETGATSVTHCFNAMSGFLHREVGLVGATLLHNELNAEIIADGIHVSPKAIEILFKNKGKENMTLVTDSMRAKGLKDGEYDLGGQMVTVSNNEARLSDKTLAGSVLSMLNAVKNIMQFVNISLQDAIIMASVNPAKKLGIYDRKGSIEVNKDCDLVVLDKEYNLLMTIVKGKIVYQKE